MYPRQRWGWAWQWWRGWPQPPVGQVTRTAPDGGPPSNDPRAVAADAYVFGYPLVLMDATRASSGPMNRLLHAHSLPTPGDRVVVRMNLDTLYSQAWLDLMAEPLVLQVPAMDADRYWLMQMMDAWSNTVHNPSSVHPQVQADQVTPPFTYMLTGPAWSGTVPPGITRLAMPTNTVWMIGRVQVYGQDDIAAVRVIQAKMILMPLSGWLAHPDGRTPGLTINASQKKPFPQRDVAAMDGPTFFTKMCALMAADPPAAADKSAMDRFASIGVSPRGTPCADAAVLNAGIQAARREIATFHDPAAEEVNGWLFSTDFGTYGTNYVVRAYTAFFGLGANLPADTLYPTFSGLADANGAPKRFRLHFPVGQLPPVDAFWSITAYDADGLLVPNPANIHAVGHQIPVKANSDGSVDIAVQNADPGPAVPAGNWLPIPATGMFSLTMRLYAPKPRAARGQWQPPRLETVTWAAPSRPRVWPAWSW